MPTVQCQAPNGAAWTPSHRPYFPRPAPPFHTHQQGAAAERRAVGVVGGRAVAHGPGGGVGGVGVGGRVWGVGLGRGGVAKGLAGCRLGLDSETEV